MLESAILAAIITPTTVGLALAWMRDLKATPKFYTIIVAHFALGNAYCLFLFGCFNYLLL